MASLVCRATGGEGEWRLQRYRTKVVDLHLAGHGDDVMLAIGFGHGFVQQRRDDAAVSVPWRSFESAREAHGRYDLLVIVDEEFQAQPRFVRLPAAKAVMERAVRERSERLRCHASPKASRKSSRSILPPVSTTPIRLP